MPPTVAAGAVLETCYAVNLFFEGPTWDPLGQALYFTAWGSDTTKILRYDEAGKTTVWIDDAQGVNGTYLGKDGRLLGAQVHTHRVVAYGLSGHDRGQVETLAENGGWNQPNDLCLAPDGSIYFSDPDFGKHENSAVYRIDLDGKVIQVLTDMPAPNGLIVSADGRSLVVADSHLKWWRAYPIHDDGTVGAGRVFFISELAEPRDPDGMTIDERGNYYLTGGDGVWVVGPTGEARGMIPVPEFVSNVTFGGPSGNVLFMTCQDKLYRLQMQVRGAR